MPTREERLAQNEVRFREINESAQPLREQRAAGRFVCECSNNSCTAWIEVEPAVYQRVRANPRHFLVARHHDMPDIETVVESAEQYSIVEKPERVAHIVE